MLYEQFGEIEVQVSEPWWCPWVLCGHGGENANRIKEYIKNQLKEDEMGE